MNKDVIDEQVSNVCKHFNWSIPDAWCYPGDLVFDILGESLFICGDDPKDVTELRRRSISYKKVDIETLKQFLVESYP